MKKRAILLCLAAATALTLSACTQGGYVQDSTININPVSEVKDTGVMSIGDVMPFYDGEAFNIYHLQNKTGSNPMWYHPIACVSTTDFVHYEEKGVALNFEEYYDSYDAALGTGSFIRDEEGRVHCFYTGHNPELHPTEVVRHAVSVDNQKTWIKDENFSMQNGTDDFRDPYLYYDGTTKKYNMLVTTRKNNTGVIERYTSDSLSSYADEWKRDNTTFFVNDDGTYNMECPAFFEYSGFYYLTYSEQGDHRVTHYRYKKNIDDNWIRPENDAIDGEGFYAGRPEQANGELYCFAWCAKTTTGDDYGIFDWAGNLVAHKIKQKPNGELYPVMIPNIKKSINTKKQTKLDDTVIFDGSRFEAKSGGTLSDGATRMSFKFSPTTLDGNCGLTFGVSGDGDNRLGNGVIAFDAENGTLSYYNDVFSSMRYRSPLVTMPFKYEKDKDYKVDVIIDGQIVSVYLADELAISIRIYSMPGSGFALYSNGMGVAFKEIAVYE